MSDDAAILRRVASPPRPSWLYLLVGAVSWPIVKVVFRHRATGVERWATISVTFSEPIVSPIEPRPGG